MVVTDGDCISWLKHGPILPRVPGVRHRVFTSLLFFGWLPPGPFEGPSGFVEPGKTGGVAMSEADIAETIRAFAQAAWDAKALGFKGESSIPRSLDELLRRFDRGDFDLVAVGRPLLADAQWTRKIREGRSSELQGFTKDALAALS
jgi:2,4-dienoyl-CoA reductase-like NADH-dependent reductase (Old Yellow Enzyme family)